MASSESARRLEADHLLQVDAEQQTEQVSLPCGTSASSLSWRRVAAWSFALGCLCLGAGIVIQRVGNPWSETYESVEKLLVKRSLHGHGSSSHHGKIRHQGGHCLEVPKVHAGVHARMWNCRTEFHTSAESLRYVSSTDHIVNKHGLCMTAVGRHVHLWHCRHDMPSQQWHHNGHHIVNKRTGHCLAEVGKKTSHLEMHGCVKGSSHQAWRMSTSGGFGTIRHGKLGCLHMPRSAITGSQIHVQACFQHKSASLKTWTYVPASGHLRIGHNLCLNAPAPHHAGSSVHLAHCNVLGAGEGWRYYRSGQLVARTSGLCLSAKKPHANGGKVYLWYCNRHKKHQRWQLARLRGASGAAPYPPRPTGKMHEFYMYRAAAAGTMGDYPFGDINTANMEGVLWYLLNEVVNMYYPSNRCPRKFGISLIYRFKVRVMATPEMIKKGMVFGARFAYDRGQCNGRCFKQNQCTCWADCRDQFRKYGYVPGCNIFHQNYPFPDGNAPQAPHGIWYSLPLEGRCKYPTGAHHCTWSYEHAGVISLKDLELRHPGGGNCCNGRCTSFWNNFMSPQAMQWRVGQTMNLFKEKYPHLPRDLHQSFCDFKPYKWYPFDHYHRKPGGLCPNHH